MNILLVGTGPMAIEHLKVLNALNKKIIVVGRGYRSSNKFFKKTNIKPHIGGINKYLNNSIIKSDFAIVSVGVDELCKVTNSLLKNGIKNILVEKPGGLNLKELNSIKKNADKSGANVFIAYNRRFYASTIYAEKAIKKDGGVISFNFEFTEWANEIEKLNKNLLIKENWFLANSSHVVDLAFFLGGIPKKIKSFTKKGNLNWHKSANVFAGAGETSDGKLFSYNANWNSPGRWRVDMLTKKSRYIFAPMEKLKIQKINCIDVNYIQNINYNYDIRFKPGIYLQTKNFLNRKFSRMLNINDMISYYKIYKKIANY